MSKGSSGGSSSQTVTQKADPWVGAQPYYNQLYPSTGAWFNNAATANQAYPGQTVAGINGQQQQGMQSIMAQAPVSQQATNDAVGGAQFIGHGNLQYNYGTNPVMNGQMAGSNPWASGQMAQTNALANGQFVGANKIANGDLLASDPYAQGQNNKQNPFTSLSSYADNPNATGQFLEQGNPYLRGMVEAAQRPIVSNFQNAVAPSLASQFSSAGRMGSGAHLQAAQTAQQQLGQQLGDTSAQLYGQAYGQERNIMAQAYGQERGLTNQAIESGLGRQFSAYGQERGAQQGALSTEYAAREAAMQQERQNMMAAYSQERGAQQQGFLAQPGQNLQQQQMQLSALGMVPGLTNAGFVPGQQQMGVGNQLQQQQQSEMGAAVDRYNYNRDAPLNNLMAYSSILSGSTPYVSSSQSGNSKNQLPFNPLSGAIGGGLGGYALGGLIPAIGGPAGAIGGALLGGLFG